MAKLKKAAIKFALTFTAGAIAGILLGSAAISTIASLRLDSLYEKIALLEKTIQEKNAKLESLEKAINSRNLVLTDIELILTFDQDKTDDMDKIAIEKTIKEKYLVFLGDEVRNIDADVITLIADNRILKINNKEFILNVEKLVLTEVLKLWIRVREVI
ncbi:MAG: hypothetical protein GXX10_12610 [Clostridiaceae bacterium]|nr:hypothetical protein [Clostridiaceae bacterium]